MNAGDRLGPYQIIRLIGRGAMGEVFLAHDTETQRDIALKIVYRGPEAEDQDIIDAERLGAELQQRLSGFDRRVVMVHKYGEIAGDLFVDMEFVDGEDLSAVLSRGPVKPGFAVHVARELCGMLENLGAFTTTIGERRFAGIIHGDLKPRNIRINRQNQVKVLDFGIAKALTHTRKYTMNVFASTAYCSPERLETQNMDSHSDLWAVGVLLYQMVANRLPFDEPTKERLERRIRSMQPPDPLPDSCPEPLRRIVFKMLARDPGRRYQSALEVAEDLARFQKSERVLAESISSGQPTDENATVRTTPPDRQPSSGEYAIRPQHVFPSIWQPKRANRALGCLAIFGVGCLALFTFISMQLNFWGDADKLKMDLETERVSNLNDAWMRYQGLTKRMHLGIFLWGAKGALRKRLVGAADETIAEYRNSDAPMISETQWADARNDLSRALEVDPNNGGITGRLRLVEGHIDRIDAMNLRGTARQKRLNEAVNKFTEAEDLLKRSPDPYLGLANVYIYDLNDVERAQDALRKAAHYGHAIGKRETTQLADGYRRRADRTWRESRGFIQSPSQERDYLDKAREDYIHAEDLYQRAGLFGDAARNQLQALQGQQRVEQRLNQLQESTISQ
ncbi:MAG: protein kinase [Acidobacteriaceae bacterium]|nr:protein kinase [Acidobacteriaceae bacterium]MBV9782171.1 protein kinase [Acidobacteriaceae bacterium]